MGLLSKMKLGAAAVLWAANSVSVQAQSVDDVPVNTKFGAWTVTCQAISVSRNVCRLIQEQVLTNSDTLVARFIALPAEEGGAVLLAQVPMGVYLPGGAVYRLENDENAEQRSMVWQRCLGDICEAAIGLDADELTQMNESGGVLFGYSAGPTSEPIVTRVDLTDFVKGLDALRSAGE